MLYKVEYIGLQRASWRHRKPTWAVIHEYLAFDWQGCDYIERRQLSRHHDEFEAYAELNRWVVNACSP